MVKKKGRTPSSRRRQKSSRKPGFNLPVLGFSALLLAGAVLITAILSVKGEEPQDQTFQLISIFQGHGLTMEPVGMEGATQFWRVNVEDNPDVVDEVRRDLKLKLGQNAIISNTKLITEKGGYGLSTEEILADGRRTIIYFVSSPPSTERGRVIVKVKDTRALGVIVLDDLGYRKSIIDFFRRIGVPVSAAILPCLPHSRYLAEELHGMGCEVLLHIPMEPERYPLQNPGEGVILKSMTSDEVRSVVEADLFTVPNAAGLNNHMGSAATADARLMNALMDVVAARKLFFLDSRTTAKTVAMKIALSRGVPSVSRDIFLDDLAEPAYIRGQLKEFVRTMDSQGYAVAIGHPNRATLAVLEEELPLIAEDYNLVTIGELIKNLEAR